MKSGFPKKHFTLVFFIIPLFFSFKASAQTAEPIKSGQGEVVTMHSGILKEDRKIMIYTPKDADNPEKKYPVVYVLDADNHFSQM
jgi:enterochelin esterase-like enzyme